MKKKVFTFLAIFFTYLATGQTPVNQKMIDLGKIYKDYMFRNEPTKDVLKDAETGVPENLKAATDFILQTITTKNKLLTATYLSRPEDAVLKQIYIIRAIDNNLREEDQVNPIKLIDSLSSQEIPTYELLDNYYEMLFTAVGNKNQPFNLSKINFNMKEYRLKDDTEKGIMFLRCVDYCGKTIWGYMNIVKPPNTKEAYKYIKKFPKFNGRAYFQYTDFYFPDFEMTIIKDKGVQSYKSYYLNLFYGTLLSHLICLKNEGGSEDEKNDLLLGSILREQNLYKYTKYKKTLEEIFKVQKVE